MFSFKEDTRLVLEEVGGWCQKVIKKFTLFYEEIKNRLETSEPVLQGDHKKLYEIIKQERSNDITKELVISVLASIEKSEEENDIESRVNIIKKEL